MNTAIDLILALGPVFGVSTLLGDRRTQAIEAWLLRVARIMAPASLLATVIPIALVAVVLFLYATIKVVEALNAGVSYALPDLTPALGCLVVILWLPVIFLVQWQVLRFEAWLVGTYAARVCRYCGNFHLPIPWPFSWFKTEQRPRDAFLILVIWPLVTMVYVTAAGTLLAIGAALLPLRLAEVVRSRLTPDKPHYLNIVAYSLSLCAMVVKIVGIVRR